MSKEMKKLSAFLLMIIMAVVMIPTIASAEKKVETRVAIYVQTPDDWENPCIWAWDEEGNNAFEAWPGGEMEADTENDGWYYVWIPDWANHVIINANEGNVQTEEQVLEGKDTWVTISAADSVKISYEKMTKGETPEYVEKFAVHAKVDASWEKPCLWAWSAPDGTNAFEAWPGKEMKEGETDWYTAKVPVWVNSIIINAKEGGIQTEDISIDPAEVWVTVDAEGKYEFSYTDPEKEEVANITVRVKAPADWEKPCLWAWSAPDGTNVYTTWPGEEFEEDENGWLKKEIPGWVNSIIVNGSEGSVQTTDVSVDTGKDIWVVVNGPEDYEVSYEQPDVNTEVAADDTTAVAEEETTEAVETLAQTEAESSNNVMPIVVGIIIAAAVVVVIVVVRKKKMQEK